MSQRFKSIKEFEKFCDESLFCVCGRLMTGLHMMGCRKLNKIRLEILKRAK